MSEDTFTAGETVQLKSGGPPMTVRFQCGIDAARHTDYKIGVHCDWFDGKQHCYAVFGPWQLVRVQPDK